MCRPANRSRRSARASCCRRRPGRHLVLSPAWPRISGRSRGGSLEMVPVVSAEVQRTLVKSPPELWAELSDPVALSRHLGELGEIRITRVEPEHKVEWAAESARGTVLMKASGWGTRVTLTATADAAEGRSTQ